MASSRWSVSSMPDRRRDESDEEVGGRLCIVNSQGGAASTVAGERLTTAE
jgi:hypothetical protein